MARPHSIPDQPKPKAAARQRRHAGPQAGLKADAMTASDRTPGYSRGKRPQAFRDTGPDKPSSAPPAAEYGRKEDHGRLSAARLARAGNPASRTVQRNASWRGGQPGLCADRECRGRGRGQPEGQAAGAAAGRPKGQGRRFLGMAQTLREWGWGAPPQRPRNRRGTGGPPAGSQQQGSCGARPWPAGRGGGRLNAAGAPKIRRRQAWERSRNSIKLKTMPANIKGGRQESAPRNQSGRLITNGTLQLLQRILNVPITYIICAPGL